MISLETKGLTFLESKTEAVCEELGGPSQTTGVAPWRAVASLSLGA